MARIYRIKINDQLLGDFYPAKQDPRGTIIFLGGLPSYPHKSRFTEGLARRGYHVVQPFYYGSWASGEMFSPQNCMRTVEDTINALVEKGSVFDLYNKKEMPILTQSLYLGGISFGTNVIQSLTSHTAIEKAFLISTVPLWKKPYLEQIGLHAEHFISFLQKGYPYVYRVENWNEWEQEFRGDGGVFSTFRANPEHISVFQGENDKITPAILNRCFETESIPLQVNVVADAGHALDEFDQERLTDLVEQFLNSKNG